MMHDSDQLLKPELLFETSGCKGSLLSGVLSLQRPVLARTKSFLFCLKWFPEMPKSHSTSDGVQTHSASYFIPKGKLSKAENDATVSLNFLFLFEKNLRLLERNIASDEKNK